MEGYQFTLNIISIALLFLLCISLIGLQFMKLLKEKSCDKGKSCDKVKTYDKGKSEIANLKSGIQDLDDEIKDSKSEVLYLKSRIENLEDEILDLRTEIKSLQSLKSDNQIKINTKPNDKK